MGKNPKSHRYVGGRMASTCSLGGSATVVGDFAVVSAREVDIVRKAEETEPHLASKDTYL